MVKLWRQLKEKYNNQIAEKTQIKELSGLIHKVHTATVNPHDSHEKENMQTLTANDYDIKDVNDSVQGLKLKLHPELIQTWLGWKLVDF